MYYNHTYKNDHILHHPLRNRLGFSKSLIQKTVDLNDSDFIVRNLYKTSY